MDAILHCGCWTVPQRSPTAPTGRRIVEHTAQTGENRLCLRKLRHKQNQVFGDARVALLLGFQTSSVGRTIDGFGKGVHARSYAMAWTPHNTAPLTSTLR